MNTAKRSIHNTPEVSDKDRGVVIAHLEIMKKIYNATKFNVSPRDNNGLITGKVVSV